MRITHANATRIAAALYTSASLIAALAFVLAATLGDYNWVARLGGAFWIFVLSMIILMPTLTPLIHQRASAPAEQHPPAHHSA